MKWKHAKDLKSYYAKHNDNVFSIEEENKNMLVLKKDSTPLIMFRFDNEMQNIILVDYLKHRAEEYKE